MGTHRAALNHLKKNDQKLAQLIAKAGPCGLGEAESFKPFEALFSAICHQQLHGKAAMTILGRLKDSLAGGKWPTPEQVKKARMTTLRKAGLSKAKSLAVKDLAARTLDGTVPTSTVLAKLSDEEVVERLTSVRGIGPWTVQMMLMFRMARRDVLPLDDYGVRKGFTRWYGKKQMVSKQELEAWAERWRPHRSVASWYLWRAAELP